MSAAVAAPRFHHQWLPDVVMVEPGVRDTSALKAHGHHIRPRGSIGQVDAVLVLPDGRLEGGADPRGDNHAEGL